MIENIPATPVNLRHRYQNEGLKLHHPFIAELLATKGVRTRLENNQIAKLEWDNQKEDFELLSWLLANLLSHPFSIDQNLGDQLSGLVAELDLKMQQLESNRGTYRQLNDSSIEVSAAHRGTTPYQHKKEVLAKLKTVDFVRRFETAADQRLFLVQMAMAVFLHDWGKMILANGDVFSYHAEMSYLMAVEWAESIAGKPEILAAGWLPTHTEQLLTMVRYHHTFELLDKGVLQTEDVRALVPDFATFAALSLLVTADSESVASYTKFAFGSIIDALRSLSAEELAQPEFEFLLVQLVNWLQQLVSKIIDQVHTKVEYLQIKIEVLRTWIEHLPQEFHHYFIPIWLQLDAARDNQDTSISV